MSTWLFPRTFDNTYTGRKAALWLLGLVSIIKILQGVVLILNGRDTIMSADGVPLDTFAPAASQTVVAIWALLGFSRIVFSLLGVGALVRYRSAVPLMLLLLVLDYLGRQIVLQYIPLPRVGSPVGPMVNLGMFAAALVGLALSFPRNEPLKP